MSIIQSSFATDAASSVIAIPEGATGVLVPVSAEQVASTVRDGNDLVVILKTGGRIVISDFYDTANAEARDLVFRDPENGAVFEVSLDTDGAMTGVEPRTLSDIAEMFSTTPAELAAFEAVHGADGDALSGGDHIARLSTQGADGAADGAIDTVLLVGGLAVVGGIAAVVFLSDDDDDDDDDNSAPTAPQAGSEETAAPEAGASEEGNTIGGEPVDRPANLIISGSALGDDLFGRTGDDVLIGHGGNDVLNGGAGDDELTGGPGSDTFSFFPTVGSDRVTDFDAGDGDRLQFNDGLFADLNAVRAAATETDGNLEIAISETETLTVDGASLADLTVDTVTTLDAEGNDTTSMARPTGVLRITGDDVIPGEGEPVTVTASADGLGAVEYQWQRSTDSGFEDIADATGQTYTLGDADTGRTVRVQVSYTASNGTDETVALVASLPTDNARTEIEEFAAANSSILLGTADDDVLTGSPGDDTFAGGINGAGADRFEGGTGNDSVEYFVPGDATDLTVNLETGRGEGGTAQGDTFVSIENVVTGGGDDTIIGNAANNKLVGLFGDDTLRGGAGNDELDDGPGNDTLEGGDGDDVLLNDEGNDSLSGGPGNDVLFAGGSRAALEDVSDNDTLDGGAGNDTVTYFGLGSDEGIFAGVEASLVTGQATVTGFNTVDDPDREEPLTSTDTLINIENLVGGEDDDTLTGDREANRLDGNRGNDIINGGNGNDHITGGTGNDTLTGGDGDDVFRFNAVEYLEESVIAFSVGGADETVFTPIGPGSDRVTDFGAGNDRLEFDGGLFADLNAVRAAATETEDGNLEIAISETETLTLLNASLDDLTADTVTTRDAQGRDSTTSTPADLTGGVSTGFSGREALLGSGDNDILDGGRGDDTLFGRGGDDRLSGGDGNDRFLFTGDEEGDDTITDFDAVSDVLVFDEGEWNGEDGNDLQNLLNAVFVGNDGSIVIDRPGENGGTITLEGSYEVNDVAETLTATSVSFDPDASIV